jgi:colicin import membrane protein
MDINSEVRERILNAAQQLFEESGRLVRPTVDAVRKLSKSNMNDASAVMKEWRRMQTATAAATVVAVPDRVQHAGQTAIASLWTEAQELAQEALTSAQAAWDTERAEAEKLRVELSSAFETQGAELETIRDRLADVETQAVAAATAAEQDRLEAQRQIAALTDTAHTAVGRAEEIQKRAEDLRRSLDASQISLRDQTAETNKERQYHDTLRVRAEALAAELATVKARAEANAGVQVEQVERLRRLEVELTQARAATATAREDAARLRGQADTLQAQNAELMEALKLRESGRSDPKGGKKSS